MWKARSWDQQSRLDAINQALSWANACLYGLCHAAIVSAGYIPSLGFIHSGNIRSFVFDVADFYKAELAIPTAFAVVAESTRELETRVRRRCRDTFKRGRLLERVIPDIDRVLAAGEGGSTLNEQTAGDVAATGVTETGQ